MSFYLCFWNLNSPSFGHHDEAIHATVSYDMYSSGNWLTPKFAGSKYYNKPPLKLWLTAATIPILGDKNFTFRFWDAASGIGTVFLTFYAGIIFFESSTTGFLAAILLLSSKTFLFDHVVRQGTQDSFLVFLSTASIICGWFLILAIKNRTNFKLFALSSGCLMGLAILTKSIAGLLPIFILSAFLLNLFFSEFDKKRALSILFYLLMPAFILPAFWYIPNFIIGHITFFDLIEAKRFTHGFHNQTQHLLYFTGLKNGDVIPAFLLTCSIVLFLYRALWSKSEPDRFILYWAIFPLILYSCLSSRAMYYLAPAFPAYALLGGSTFNTTLIWAYKKYLIRNYWPACAGLIFCIYFCFITIVPLSKNISAVYKKEGPSDIEEITRFIKNKVGSGPALYIYYKDNEKNNWLGRTYGARFYLQLISPSIKEITGPENLKKIIASDTIIDGILIASEDPEIHLQLNERFQTQKIFTAPIKGTKKKAPSGNLFYGPVPKLTFERKV